MKKDFIPRRNSNLNSFVNNFIERLDTYSADLAMNDSDVDEAKNVLENYVRSFAKMNSLRAESKAATEEFNSVRENTVDLIRRLSNQIKSSKKYKPEMGEDFGIINRHSPVTDFSGFKPDLKAKVNGSMVSIRYIANSADGIKLYSKRGNESEFTELAYVFKRIYNDKRPKLSPANPEAREYYAFYIVKDKVSGQKSDVIKVVVP